MPEMRRLFPPGNIIHNFCPCLAYMYAICMLYTTSLGYNSLVFYLSRVSCGCSVYYTSYWGWNPLPQTTQCVKWTNPLHTRYFVRGTLSCWLLIHGVMRRVTSECSCKTLHAALHEKGLCYDDIHNIHVSRAHFGQMWWRAVAFSI